MVSGFTVKKQGTVRRILKTTNLSCFIEIYHPFFLLTSAIDIGLYTFNNGCSYEGMFLDDNYHGKGIMKLGKGIR